MELLQIALIVSITIASLALLANIANDSPARVRVLAFFFNVITLWSLVGAYVRIYE
jgi:hypothetical protein